MLPLFGPMLVSLQNPLLLRQYIWGHARWTRHVVVTRLRAVRSGSKR